MDNAGVCPYLGTPGDRETHYGYPNALNTCYAGRAGWADFEPVELDYQRQLCLTQEHGLCPTYLSAMATTWFSGRRMRTQSHLQFFGLREEPFSIVPQSRFRCESGSQKRAHTGLRWLIDQQHGLGLLFGDVGTGKTLLCHTLFEELNSDHQYVSALLLTPSYHSEYALMMDLMAQWQLKPARLRSRHSLEAVAHEYLMQVVIGRKRTAVLIVDEAQTLPSRLLQQVCRLLNWQDSGQQLLQVILAGQPGLRRGLGRVPALSDRAVIEFTLTPMTLSETQKMITERLLQAGRNKQLFEPGAVDVIYQTTGGMPRRVTIMRLKCLWQAYFGGERVITDEVVEAVVKASGDGDLFAVPDQRAAALAGAQIAPARRTPGDWLRALFHRA